MDAVEDKKDDVSQQHHELKEKVPQEHQEIKEKVPQTQQNATDAAPLKAALAREQTVYTLLYAVAAMILLAMRVPAFVPALLILGAGLYNVSKLGKSNHWFQENGSADWALGTSYIIVVVVGVIAAFLYLLRVL